MPNCRECKHYAHIENTRRGYCRNEKSYYYNMLRHGGSRAAVRCFEEKQPESAEKIKPCPCCGSKAKAFKDYHGNHLIQCTNAICGIKTLTHYYIDEALKVWNRRINND